MNSGEEFQRSDRNPDRWYELAFQQEYLDLYLHRDLAEAARAVRFLAGTLELQPSHTLLDLCCGPGRHLAFLKDHVARAVGLDLSWPLLQRARQHGLALYQGGGAAALPLLVRGDMRALPLADGSFDRAVNLFTSFGYFIEADENLRVLREVARVLRGGGLFALDHINRDDLLADFEPRSERVLSSGLRVTEERHWDDSLQRIEKKVTLQSPGAEARQWLESVRVYEPDELESMLRAAGLTPLRRFGDYGGGAWSPKSPRLILVSRKI